MELARGGVACGAGLGHCGLGRGGGVHGGAELICQGGVLLRHVRDHRAVRLGLGRLGQKVDGVLGREHTALDEHGLVHLVVAGVLRVGGADLRVAAAQEGEHAGHAVQVLGEVLARERAAVVPYALLAQELHHGGTAARGRDRLVFNLGVRDGVVGELCLGSQAGGGVLHDAADVVGHGAVRGVAVGAHGAGEIGRTGDDVAGCSTVQLAHREHGRLVRADLARDDGLQGVHDLGRDHDGVVAALGHGAMAGGAAHVHAEPVGVGHAVARLAGDGPRVHLAPDMHRKGAVHAFEHTLADHELGALAVFLRGLKHYAHLAVDLVGHVAQDLQRAEHHGDMAVVAAGMHEALVHTGVLLAGLLGHGQGVDVRAQQDAAAGRAVLAVGVGRRAAQGGDQARLERALVGDVHGRELIGDVRGGALLGKAWLGMLVEVPALPDHVGLVLRGEVLDGLRDLLGRGFRHECTLLLPWAVVLTS